MSDHDEERHVKARFDHDTSKQYYHKSFKKTMSRKELLRTDMTIENEHSSAGEEE
jgi:hypothetical protein